MGTDEPNQTYVTSKMLDDALDEVGYEIAKVKRRIHALALALDALQDPWETEEEKTGLLADYGYRVPMPRDPKLRYSLDVNVFEMLKERPQLSSSQICELFKTHRQTAIASMKRLSESFPDLISVQQMPIRPGSKKKRWVIRLLKK